MKAINQKKCDVLLQTLGKQKYQKCEVCGNPINCLHHFFPKSVSSFHRYNWDNLIPICQGCHMRHHLAGDPSIHQVIIRKRGQKWYDELEKHKRDYTKCDKFYYQSVYEKLSTELFPKLLD